MGRVWAALGLVTACLLSCGKENKAQPLPPPPAPTEAQVDRLTLLREAQKRNEAAKEKRREELRAVGEATVTKKKQLGKKKEEVKLELEFEFTNKSEKTVTLAEGAMEFHDASGKVLKSLKVPFQGPIAPGKKAEKRGKFPVDPGVDGDVVLVKSKLAELKLVWVPKRYRFDDGTELLGE
jgi:hypothetical protein